MSVFFLKERKERIVGHLMGATRGFPWCILCPFVHLLMFKVAHPYCNHVLDSSFFVCKMENYVLVDVSDLSSILNMICMVLMALQGPLSCHDLEFNSI